MHLYVNNKKINISSYNLINNPLIKKAIKLILRHPQHLYLFQTQFSPYVKFIQEYNTDQSQLDIYRMSL